MNTHGATVKRGGGRTFRKVRSRLGTRQTSPPNAGGSRRAGTNKSDSTSQRSLRWRVARLRLTSDPSDDMSLLEHVNRLLVNRPGSGLVSRPAPQAAPAIDGRHPTLMDEVSGLLGRSASSGNATDRSPQRGGAVAASTAPAGNGPDALPQGLVVEAQGVGSSHPTPHTLVDEVSGLLGRSASSGNATDRSPQRGGAVAASTAPAGNGPDALPQSLVVEVQGFIDDHCAAAADAAGGSAAKDRTQGPKSVPEERARKRVQEASALLARLPPKCLPVTGGYGYSLPSTDAEYHEAAITLIVAKGGVSSEKTKAARLFLKDFVAFRVSKGLPGEGSPFPITSATAFACRQWVKTPTAKKRVSTAMEFLVALGMASSGHVTYEMSTFDLHLPAVESGGGKERSPLPPLALLNVARAAAQPLMLALLAWQETACCFRAE